MIMIETHAPSAYPYPLLIRHLWHTPLNNNPQQQIVSGESRRYDYTILRERIGRLAAALTELGIGKGNTVAVMDWDSHRYLECFFAIPMMGAVLHTVNVRLAPEQILYTINHATDDAILLHADFMPIIEQIRDRIQRPPRLVYIDDREDAATPPGFAAEYESMLAAVGTGHEFEDFDENTTATTFYTTGTTGEPKGVFYSHRQLVLHTLGLVADLGSADGMHRFHRGDVYMPLTPMFHVHAWGMPYAATLMGVKQVYPGRYRRRHLFTLRAGDTADAAGRPRGRRRRPVELEGRDRRLGDAAGAGARRGRTGNRRLDRSLSETCPLLTMADMSGITEVDTGDAGVARRCVTGKPVGMVELRVVDARMNEIPRGGAASGEIVVRAPWLTQGYAGDQPGSQALWESGYLHTGDVGYLDDGGSLHITDRLKDVIKSGGEWISSLQLEDIVSRCDGVAEAAAIGVADHRWGERPLLIVVRAKPELSAEQVLASIRAEVDGGRLSKWALPERVEFVDALPRTSVGKLDKKALRGLYGND
jgi:fatty-acyl-CoA synthase